jgi:hypothetical protein
MKTLITALAVTAILATSAVAKTQKTQATHNHSNNSVPHNSVVQHDGSFCNFHYPQTDARWVRALAGPQDIEHPRQHLARVGIGDSSSTGDGAGLEAFSARRAGVEHIVDAGGQCGFEDAGHSGFAPEYFTTLAHFSVSSAMSFPKSEAEPPSIVPPRSASRAFIFGSARMVLISILSLSMISAGVFLGTPIPCHELAS